MKYPLAKKAYLVGHKKEIDFYGYPENPSEIIHVMPNEGAGKALSKYMDRHVYNYVDLRARRHKSDDAYLYEGNEWCLNLIRISEDTKKWRSDMVKLVEENKGAKVYIYSGQWGAYWCPNYSGYTTHKNKAGIYDIEDAWAHTSHCGIEKHISFVLLNKVTNVERSVANADAQ